MIKSDLTSHCGADKMHIRHRQSDVTAPPHSLLSLSLFHSSLLPRSLFLSSLSLALPIFSPSFSPSFSLTLSFPHSLSPSPRHSLNNSLSLMITPSFSPSKPESPDHFIFPSHRLQRRRPLHPAFFFFSFILLFFFLTNIFVLIEACH